VNAAGNLLAGGLGMVQTLSGVVSTMDQAQG
jgi:hypothetical protein